MTLFGWVLLALIAHDPGHPAFPGHEETAAEAFARRVGIAHAITVAAEEEQGWLTDRAEAALLISVAIGESGLSRDTDVGPCFRGTWDGRGYSARCDRGKSASVWQVWASAWGHSPEQIFADRVLAARLALRAARGSLGMCKALPAEDRLSGLSGKCIRGLEAARGHYRRWNWIQAWEPSAAKGGE